MVMNANDVETNGKQNLPEIRWHDEFKEHDEFRVAFIFSTHQQELVVHVSVFGSRRGGLTG